MHMMTSLSVDEILLPIYMNRSTNFKGLPFNEEMVPSLFKYMKTVLFEFDILEIDKKQLINKDYKIEISHLICLICLKIHQVLKLLT